MQYIDMKVMNELTGILSSVETLLEQTKDYEISSDIADVLLFTLEQLNNQLYMVPQIDLKAVDAEGRDDGDIRSRVEIMLPIWKLSLERRGGLKTDSEFWAIYEYFKYVDRNSIIANVMSVFESYPEEYKRQFTSLPHRYTFLTGKIDMEEGDYSLIPIYVDMMKAEIENFKWLYDKLADFRSKQILLRIVRFWFELNLHDLSDLHENIFSDYYDLDILTCSDKEIFVDCGAYVGDSILDYIQTYGGRYQRIYAYEILPETMEQMKQNLNGYDNIILKQKGVGKKNDLMYIDEDSHGAGTKIADTGKNAVEVVALDQDIKEPVTVIKMDIEGAEQDALKGARKHIE